MATSPDKRGGASVPEAGRTVLPFQGAVIQGVFSFPAFNENYDDEAGITDPWLKEMLINITKDITVGKQHLSGNIPQPLYADIIWYSYALNYIP